MKKEKKTTDVALSTKDKLDSNVSSFTKKKKIVGLILFFFFFSDLFVALSFCQQSRD